MKYKKSKFNIDFIEDNLHFIYNSHTGSFATLNNEFLNTLHKVDDSDSAHLPVDHIEQLFAAGFIVKQNTNENLIYDFLTNQTKYSGDSLGLTIATTLQCNFRCPYCYEEHIDSYFDSETERNLIEFIKNNLEGKKHLSITWYGGEPLLQKDLIHRVSKEVINFCKEKNINYEASMVSNGYLLNRFLAEKLAYEDQVHSVQITLDGGPSTHNQTRFLRNGEATFNKILEHIKLINDVIQVNIRVNVSKDNVSDVYEIFHILLDNDLSEKVSIYFSPVTSHEGSCQSVSESCLVTEEFSKWEMELIAYADRLGFQMGHLYPENMRGAVCTAVNSNSFVIDSKGNLYKCWNEVGKEELKVGTLKDGLTAPDKYLSWIEWSFPSKCRECAIFPLCKGRCPDMSKNNQEFECAQLKFNITNKLIRYRSLVSENKESLKLKKELLEE